HEPVSLHHKPDESHEFSQVTAAVHVADVWINKYQQGSSGERSLLPTNELALEQLNLKSEELDDIWIFAEESMKDVMKQFLVQ
ncbi:MAG: hypothetical protein KAU21_11255, partial [Gammaproteobacteria bacterium]|nr:hypothetical protein [Gammaproteobacteria bacterium]